MSTLPVGAGVPARPSCPAADDPGPGRVRAPAGAPPRRGAADHLRHPGRRPGGLQLHRHERRHGRGRPRGPPAPGLGVARDHRRVPRLARDLHRLRALVRRDQATGREPRRLVGCRRREDRCSDRRGAGAARAPGRDRRRATWAGRRGPARRHSWCWRAWSWGPSPSRVSGCSWPARSARRRRWRWRTCCSSCRWSSAGSSCRWTGSRPRSPPSPTISRAAALTQVLSIGFGQHDRRCDRTPGDRCAGWAVLFAVLAARRFRWDLPGAGLDPRVAPRGREGQHPGRGGRMPATFDRYRRYRCGVSRAIAEDLVRRGAALVDAPSRRPSPCSPSSRPAAEHGTGAAVRDARHGRGRHPATPRRP